MFTRIRSGWALYKTLRAQNKVPLNAKVLVIGAIVYVLSPLDLLPDPIAIVGLLDDIVVFITALHYGIKWLEQRATPADRARAEAIDVTPK